MAFLYVVKNWICAKKRNTKEKNLIFHKTIKRSNDVTKYLLMIPFPPEITFETKWKKENSAIIVFFFSSFTLHFPFYYGNNRRERLDSVLTRYRTRFSPSSGILLFESTIFSTRDTLPSLFTDSRQLRELPGFFRRLSAKQTTHRRTLKFRISFRTNRAYLSRSGSSRKKTVKIQFLIHGKLSIPKNFLGFDARIGIVLRSQRKLFRYSVNN